MQPTPTPAGSGKRPGLPRWAWALIAALAVIALVSAAVIVFAPRGRTITSHPATAPTASPAPPAATTLADGCLGGTADLDRALLTAQEQAPLTAPGAAAFTATLVRWGDAVPWPADRVATAQQIDAADATAAANPFRPGGTATVRSTSFTDGRFYVESLTGTTAVVSYLGTAAVSKNGIQQADLSIGGSAHLVAVSGKWHLRDITAERTLDELQRIGTPYAGGC
jgi:hypothetical protein